MKELPLIITASGKPDSVVIVEQINDYLAITRDRTGTLSLTHIPTTYRFPLWADCSHDELRDVAEKVKAFDWNFTLEDVPKKPDALKQSAKICVNLGLCERR